MANTTTSTNTNQYNLRTSKDKLLKLENDGTLTVNGDLQDYLQSSVRFYLDITSNSSNQRIVKIQPVNGNGKFLAVSGTTLVLKGLNELADNSHSFIEREPNDDYMKYQVIASPSNAQTFITADQSGAVIIAGDSASDPERAWFHPQLVINTSGPVASRETDVLFFENISEGTISIQGTISDNTIAVKGTISEDFTISGKVTMSEE